MKKRNALFTLITMGLTSLHASGMGSVSDPAKTTSGGMDPAGYAKAAQRTKRVLDPYQKLSGGQTFFLDLEYVGGIFGPQNRGIAVIGINPGSSSDKMPEHPIVQFPLTWTNGFALSLGFVKAGPNHNGFISEILFVTNNNGTNEVVLDIESNNMISSYPLEQDTGNTLPIFRAAGNYHLPCHAAYKVFYLGNFLQVDNLSVLLQTGIAGTYTKHILNTSYSLRNIPVDPDEDVEQSRKIVALEKVTTIGPSVGIQVRKVLKHGIFLEAILGTTGQVAYRTYRSHDENVNEPLGRASSFNVKFDDIFGLVYGTEATIGFGFACEFDWLELEYSMSWSTIASSDYTMLVSPPYGLTSGNLATFNSNFLRTGVSVKF